MPPISLIRDTVVLHIKVTPQSKQNKVLPCQDGEDYIRIKVTAVPEDGKANQAVCKCLAKHLAIAGSRVKITSGTSSRNKSVTIQLCNTEDRAEDLTEEFEAIKAKLSIY